MKKVTKSTKFNVGNTIKFLHKDRLFEEIQLETAVITKVNKKTVKASYYAKSGFDNDCDYVVNISDIVSIKK